MKTLFFLSFFLLVSLSSYAQEKQTTIEYKWGVSAYICNPSRNVTLDYFDHTDASSDDYDMNNKSFAFGITGNYFLSSDVGLRLRYGVTKIRIETNQEYYFSGSKVVNDVIGKQSKNHIGIGMIKKMTFNKFNFIAGFEVPLNFENEFLVIWESTQTDSVSGNVLDKFVQNDVVHRGFTVGVAGIFGFNFILNKRFSIGSEFSPSLLFSKLGGETIRTTNSIVPQSPPVTTKSQDQNRSSILNENRFSILFNINF
jgi:hypothetical protein